MNNIVLVANINSLSFRPSQFVPNFTTALINKGIKSKTWQYFHMDHKDLHE